jgi:hypothetical protein
MRLGRAIVLAVVASASAGAVLVLAPGHAGLVGHLWLVSVLALALAVALERLQRLLPARRSPFDRAFAPARTERARPAALARVEREVTLATGTAFDVHFRLRPIVRELAAGSLLRRGVDLDRAPERAQALLGPRLWELARPGRPSPEDRTAPGLPATAVEALVDDLERLACS